MTIYQNFRVKILAVGKLLILTVSSAVFCADVNAQKTTGFTNFNTGSRKIIDLSKKARAECTESIREKTGQSFIEVKFQPRFALEAENISQILKSVVAKTQELLPPLYINGVRFYLLQIDDVPKSYQIVLPKEDDLFLYLEAFSKKASLSADCTINWKFCTTLYETIPHEITHPIFRKLIDDDNTRWFEDGIAKYVGTEIARQLAPIMISREREISTQATLQREEMRNQIFDWGQLTPFKFTFMSEKDFRKESFRYEASQQLIRSMIEESKKKGVERPLPVLLEKLKQFVEKKGKPATREELIGMISQYLKVDLKTVGQIDVQTKKSLVQEATQILAKEQTSPNAESKYFALNVLASIDDVELSDEWIKFLLEIVYSQKEGDFIQVMAATALARRINQNNFDAVINKLQQTNQFFQKKDLQSVEKDLQKKSLRPVSTSHK